MSRKSGSSRTEKTETRPSWLRKTRSEQLESTFGSNYCENSLFEQIDQAQMSPYAKNLYAGYLVQIAEESDPLKRAEQTGVQPGQTSGKKKVKPSLMRIASWKHSGRFQTYVENEMAEASGKFRIAGMMSMMAATLVVYFCRAVIRGRYVLSFSADALIAAAAFAFLIVNLRSMLRAVRSCTSAGPYILMDLCAVALSVLIDLMLPAGFDASLLVFFIVYYVEKRRFQTDQAAFVQTLIPAASPSH